VRSRKLELGQAQIDQMPVVDVPVSALSVADSPRVSGESAEHVEMLAAMEDQLPPILVHRASMRVIDGMHRLKVAKLKGQETISVRFFDGGEADAFVLAVKSNIAHGLPLSLADRKRAVERMIRSHPQWSARMVASIAGISPGTVAEIRRRAVGEPAEGDVRIGQDGRVRPLNGAEGRRVARELILENPDLSLRQVARSAGVSPETVRNLKKRLNRPDAPVALAPAAEAISAPENPAAGSYARKPRNGKIGLAVSGMRGPSRAEVVERLKADPALRFNETGRDLLRLLQILVIRSEDWDRLTDSVPAHCRSMVAQLARECADTWAEFALNVDGKVGSMAEPQQRRTQG
jgi:ParB-like chromosome segregation protein Spo0J